jgi:hypothetical protein
MQSGLCKCEEAGEPVSSQGKQAMPSTEGEHEIGSKRKDEELTKSKSHRTVLRDHAPGLFLFANVGRIMRRRHDINREAQRRAKRRAGFSRQLQR